MGSRRFASPWPCFGKSIDSPIRKASNTAGSACATASGPPRSTWLCVRNTVFSSTSSARPATPSLRQPGRRNFLTGWARPLLRFFRRRIADHRTGQSAQRRHQSASLRARHQPQLPRSGRTLWRGRTARALNASPRIKPRSKSASRWSNAGSSRRCATASSSRSANSIRPSACCWISSTTGPSKSCRDPAAQTSKQNRWHVHQRGSPLGIIIAC